MTLPTSKIIEAIRDAELNIGLSGAGWLADPRNTPLSFDDGDIALFEDEGNGTFQIHFLLASRGRKAIERVKAFLIRGFTDLGATLIYGLVPNINRKMKLVARWAGFTSRGQCPTAAGPCEVFVITKGEI